MLAARSPIQTSFPASMQLDFARSSIDRSRPAGSGLRVMLIQQRAGFCTVAGNEAGRFDHGQAPRSERLQCISGGGHEKFCRSSSPKAIFVGFLVYKAVGRGLRCG